MRWSKAPQGPFLVMPVADHLEHWVRTLTYHTELYPDLPGSQVLAWACLTQILYSTGLFFGTSVLLPFVSIYIMLFSRELFPSGILEKHRNPGYLRAVALLLWLLPREFVKGRIA